MKVTPLLVDVELGVGKSSTLEGPMVAARLQKLLHLRRIQVRRTQAHAVKTQLTNSYTNRRCPPNLLSISGTPVTLYKGNLEVIHRIR